MTLLLVLCAAVPAAAILTSKSDLRELVNWRHLIAALPVVTILAGAGASPGRRFRPRPASRRPRPQRSSWPGLWPASSWPDRCRSLGEYARRTLTNDRDFFRSVSRAPDPGRPGLHRLARRNARAFAARWHLGDAMAGPGDFDRPGYRRVRFADQIFAPSQRLRAAPEGALLASWSAAGPQSRLALAGFPGHAPLLLVPDPSGWGRLQRRFPRPQGLPRRLRPHQHGGRRRGGAPSPCAPASRPLPLALGSALRLPGPQGDGRHRGGPLQTPPEPAGQIRGCSSRPAPTARRSRPWRPWATTISCCRAAGRA